MLYPIATVSYPLTVAIGLAYNAPIQGGMQFYEWVNQYVQVTITIPYTVPEGYSIRIQLLNAQFIQGTAYANFQSLNYTTTYTYSTYYLIMSSMGPIPVGTTVTVNFEIYITTTNLFTVNAYIDTASVITTFATTTGSNYLYYGLTEDSGIGANSFFWNFYDSQFSWGERVMSSATISASQWFYIQIYQNVGVLATSAGSYLDLYFSPNVIISSSFNQNVDCQLYQGTFSASWQANTCLVTITQTSTYLKITVRANTAYIVTVPNLFPFQSSTYIRLKNMAFTLSSSNKNVYPVYCALYQSDVVNPTTYYALRMISATPAYNTITGVSLQYVSNFYSTTGATNFQTYPGVLRFESTTSTALNVVVQPNQQFTVFFYAAYGFRSFTSIGNLQSYPCTSNIPIQCTYYIGNVGGYNQIFMYDRIAVTFLDLSFKTTPFHILIPDMQINQNNDYVYCFTGFYDLLTKDWQFVSAYNFYRQWNYWIPTPNGVLSTFGADIQGKAGSYRNNVSIAVYNNGIQLGGKTFLFLSTQWSFF